jgi:hypothetical protein
MVRNRFEFAVVSPGAVEEQAEGQQQKESNPSGQQPHRPVQNACALQVNVIAAPDDRYFDGGLSDEPHSSLLAGPVGPSLSWRNRHTSAIPRLDNSGGRYLRSAGRSGINAITNKAMNMKK